MRNSSDETAISTIVHSNRLENRQDSLGEVNEKEYHEIETWVIAESFVYWAEPVGKKEAIKYV